MLEGFGILFLGSCYGLTLPLHSLEFTWLSQNVTCPWKGPVCSEDQQL